MKPLIRTALSGLLLVAFEASNAYAAPPAYAQAQSLSTIAGTVTSDSGPVAGATVTLSVTTNRSVKTNADGSFSFTGLAAGAYRISVSSGGFSSVIDTPVTVAAGASETLTVTLARASLESVQTIGRVSVNNSRATVINTTAAAQSTVTQQNYIDRGQFQVSNLLEEQPGVEVTRASSGGAQGANTNVALRGADPTETQTLLDGHPVVSGTGGSYLIQFQNPLVLQSVEVDKGPGVQSNTIAGQVGGRVNFRTLDISATQRANVTGGYDSFNSSTLGINYSNTIGKVGFLVGYGRYGTPGYYNGNILYVNPDGPVATGMIPNATVSASFPATETFNNKSELVKLAYNFSPTTSLSFGYLGTQAYVDYTGTLTTVEPVNIVAGPCVACGTYGMNSGNPSYNAPGYNGLVGHTVLASTVQDNLYLGNYETDNEPIFTGQLRTSIGPGSLLARYYAGSITRIISDPQEAYQIFQCDDPSCNFSVAQSNGDTSGPYYQRENDVLHGGDFEYDLPIGSNVYTLGFDRHSLNSTACSGGNPALPASTCSVNGVVQSSQTISVRGALALGAKTQLSIGNYFSNTTFVGSRYDPHIGLVFRPDAQKAIRFAVGSSYVAPSPNIGTHLNNRGQLTVADGTKPETDVSYNLGFDLAPTGDSKFSLDVYDTVIRNRFASLTSKTPGTYNGLPYKSKSTSINQANTRNDGIELAYAKAPRFGIGAAAFVNFLKAYTYNTDQSVNQQGFVYGNQADNTQIAGYPYTHGRAELNYTFHSGAKVAFGTTYYGSLNSFNEPAFTLSDVAITAPVAHDLSLQFSVQNVFNHDNYRTLGEYAYGYAPPQVDPSNFAPNSLYFAPPRQLTLQVSRHFGP